PDGPMMMINWPGDALPSTPRRMGMSMTDLEPAGSMALTDKATLDHFDEPMSGLDSFMAESVVMQLQKLAREGRTVVATIHQPSSELFTLFDQLYLLSGGQTIYNGKACDAVAYFASQGLQCPTYMNPTDYFMRQIIVLDPHSDAATRMDVLVQAWQRHSNAMHPTIEHHNMDTDFQSPGCQNLFISTVVGLIYLQLKKDIQSFTRALFFMTVNQFIANGMPEFTNVPMELPIMIREYQGGLYQAWVWYLAKNSSELVFQLFFPLVFVVPVYFIIGFGGDAGVFFIFYVNLSLLCSAAVGMGHMVGCITRCPDVAQILGVLVDLWRIVHQLQHHPRVLCLARIPVAVKVRLARA
ncbi:hypothetical protein DYB28_007522, partial [Aphanomyces astaci]